MCLHSCWQLTWQLAFKFNAPLITQSLLQVYKGMYEGIPVAVKVCRQADLRGHSMAQFQKEVAILQGCAHANIVRFVGACTWKVCLLNTFTSSDRGVLEMQQAPAQHGPVPEGGRHPAGLCACQHRVLRRRLHLEGVLTEPSVEASCKFSCWIKRMLCQFQKEVAILQGCKQAEMCVLSGNVPGRCASRSAAVRRLHQVCSEATGVAAHSACNCPQVCRCARPGCSSCTQGQTRRPW